MLTVNYVRIIIITGTLLVLSYTFIILVCLEVILAGFFT